MLSWSRSRLLPRVSRCEIHNAKNIVTFFLDESGEKSVPTHSERRSTQQRSSSISVCREWVLDNDAARRHKSGQKSSNVYDDPALLITEVGGTAHFTSAVVSERGDEIIFQQAQSPTAATTTTPVTIRVSDVIKYLFGKESVPRCSRPLQRVEDMHRVTYKEFLEASSSFNAMALVRLAMDGVILVQGCPVDEEEAIIRLARAVDVEIPTLYGTTFKVVSAPSAGPKNNVAYSSVGLDLHQDLAYHESMPGLQFLLCQKFDSACTGGESTFLDLNYAAEVLRAKCPSAFKTLCEVPAAFMKDDWERPVPAQYYYATPHIHVNDVGDVMKCFWAPAFEAPLPPTPRMGEYYEARRQFQRVINDLMKTPLLIEFRLRPGDCVIFHQARMLHGRREFQEPSPCARQLHGTYVNVDSFRNAVITRAPKHNISVEDIPGFANRSYR